MRVTGIDLLVLLINGAGWLWTMGRTTTKAPQVSSKIHYDSQTTITINIVERH